LASFVAEITAQAAKPADLLFRALDALRIEQAVQRFRHTHNAANDPTKSALTSMTTTPVPGKTRPTQVADFEESRQHRALSASVANSQQSLFSSHKTCFHFLMRNRRQDSIHVAV